MRECFESGNGVHLDHIPEEREGGVYRSGSSLCYSRVILPCPSLFDNLLPLSDLPPSLRFPQATIQLLSRCSLRPWAWYAHFYESNRDTPLEPTSRLSSSIETPPPRWPLEGTSTQSKDGRGILTTSSSLRALPRFPALSPPVRYGPSSEHASILTNFHVRRHIVSASS